MTVIVTVVAPVKNIYKVRNISRHSMAQTRHQNAHTEYCYTRYGECDQAIADALAHYKES